MVVVEGREVLVKSRKYKNYSLYCCVLCINYVVRHLVNFHSWNIPRYHHYFTRSGYSYVKSYE